MVKYNLAMVSPKEIADVLNKPGSVVIMPTDTVYGLVSRATDVIATKYMYSLKDRHKKPGTLIGSSIEQLSGIGLKKRYLKAVEQYWPGAVSVLIPCPDPKLEYLTQGLSQLAVRVPDNMLVQEVLKYTGPLMTTSANSPGDPPAETVNQAKGYFKNSVKYYFDGGDLKGNQPSTIIRIIDDAVEVVRQGAVKI